jgi:hypothetical protein
VKSAISVIPSSTLPEKKDKLNPLYQRNHACHKGRSRTTSYEMDISLRISSEKVLPITDSDKRLSCQSDRQKFLVIA